MGVWDAWIGREELRTDRIDSGLAARWLGSMILSLIGSRCFERSFRRPAKPAASMRF